jgi:energy-converting hydrogenase A subunit R
VTRAFISDCEGPISKNDNALEIMSRFVPNGDKIFEVTSRYDDALADILKRAGYKAGDTLKLVLPFLKAYDVTDRKMKEYCAKNIILIMNAEESMHHILSIAPTYIVSTSYEHYIKALCRKMKFPFKNTYCTRLSLDQYRFDTKEKTQVKKLAQLIAKMPIFEVPPDAKSLKELPEGVQLTIEELDDIFWEQIAEMHIGAMYSEIDPVGGYEKADAVAEIARKMDLSLSDVMYVGDSITDEEAFKLVKENGGLTVSFNGNRYAIGNSEIALMSYDGLATVIVADVFIRRGKEKTRDLIANWNPQTIIESSADPSLINNFLKTHGQDLPKAKIITRENMQELAEESSKFRKKVRGIVAGELG